MKNILREQDYNLSDFEDVTPISNSKKSANQNQTSNQTQKPKLKTDTKKNTTQDKPPVATNKELKPGDVIQLKSTRLYYFENGNFVDAGYKWVYPDSTRVEYVRTSTKDKKYILVKIKGKFQFWVQLDKVLKK
jgi:hypothetical protein